MPSERFTGSMTALASVLQPQQPMLPTLSAELPVNLTRGKHIQHATQNSASNQCSFAAPFFQSSLLTHRTLLVAAAAASAD